MIAIDHIRGETDEDQALIFAQFDQCYFCAFRDGSCALVNQAGSESMAISLAEGILMFDATIETAKSTLYEEYSTQLKTLLGALLELHTKLELTNQPFVNHPGTAQ